MTTIKDPREMTDRELEDLVGFAEYMPGPFPAERVAAIALEAGRRAGVGGHVIYDRMRREWGCAYR